MNPNSPTTNPSDYMPPRPPPQSARERGGCLSLWLAASALFGALAVITLLQLWNLVLQTPNAFQRVSPVVLVLFSALIIGLLVCLGGIWNWKRWGVYGAALCSIVSPFVESAMGVANAQDWIAPIIQIAVLWYLVKDKWDDFE